MPRYTEKDKQKIAPTKIADKVKRMPVKDLIPYHQNPKMHPPEQVDKIASSIKHFGFTVPVIIDKDNEIIADHGSLEAAKKLKMKEIPCLLCKWKVD